MELTQSKAIGLAIRLELKIREYYRLCDKLKKIQKTNISPNDERLLVVKDMFQKNHDEIVEIKTELQKLKEIKEVEDKQIEEKYNPNEIFKNKINKTKDAIEDNSNSKSDNTAVTIIHNKKSLFSRIINIIKRLLK